VVGAVGSLLDSQGAPLGGAGVGQLAQILLDVGQVAEGRSDLGMVGAVGRLEDG